MHRRHSLRATEVGLESMRFNCTELIFSPLTDKFFLNSFREDLARTQIFHWHSDMFFRLLEVSGRQVVPGGSTVSAYCIFFLAEAVDRAR